MINLNFRNIFLALFKTFITVSLLFFAFSKIQLDLEAFLKIFNKKEFFLVLFIIILSLVIQNILHALRFKLAAKKHHVSLDLSKSLLIIHIAGFVGFSPIGLLGYEIIRVNFLKKITGFKKSLSILYLDRIIGLLALILVSIISYVLIIKKNLRFFNITESQLINLIILFGIIIFFYFIIISLKNYVSKIKNVKISLFCEELFYILKIDKFIDFELIFISFIMAIIVPIALALSSFLLKYECPPLIFYVLACIGILVTIIPITLGGFGLRESAFVYIAGLFNYSQEEALVISILFSTSIFIAYLPGFFILLIKKNFT